MTFKLIIGCTFLPWCFLSGETGRDRPPKMNNDTNSLPRKYFQPCFLKPNQVDALFQHDAIDNENRHDHFFIKYSMKLYLKHGTPEQKVSARTEA